MSGLFADQYAEIAAKNAAAAKAAEATHVATIRHLIASALHRLAKRKRQGKTLWDAVMALDGYVGDTPPCPNDPAGEGRCACATGASAKLEMVVALGFWLSNLPNGFTPEQMFEAVTLDERPIEGIAVIECADIIRSAIETAGRLFVLCPEECYWLCAGMYEWALEEFAMQDAPVIEEPAPTKARKPKAPNMMQESLL